MPYTIIDRITGVERDMTPEEILENMETPDESENITSINPIVQPSVIVPGANRLTVIINGAARFMSQEEEDEFLSRQISVQNEINALNVPYSVTNYQARAVLMNTPGSTAERTLFQDVNDWAQARGDAVWQAWEYSNNLTRNGELVQQAMVAFGLTNEQVDALFLAASQIEA